MSYTVGVDIGGSKIAAGLVRNRKVIRKKTISTPLKKQELIKGILDLIGQVKGGKNISGIGVGVAGQIDQKGAWVESPNIPSVRNIHLKSILKNSYRKRVEINNDANCFALEEAVLGAGKGRKNVFGLIVGTGTGGGIVIDRRIYNGAGVLAGEVGMIGYPKNIEESCSARYVAKLARKQGLKIEDPEKIAELARKGNKKARMIFEKLGENVGYLMSIIICVLNPDIIIIGGGLSKSFSLFSRAAKKSMEKHLFFSKTRKTPVRKFKNKEFGILGAALLLEKNA